MRHLPRLAELEAKLRDTTSGALGDYLAHVDAESRKRYALQQGHSSTHPHIHTHIHTYPHS